MAPEVHALEQAAAYGPHYRMRRRSQAGHSRGQSISRRACFFTVDADIVSRWLRRWRAQGVSGLREGTRSDRPPQLDAAAQKKLAAGLREHVPQLGGPAFCPFPPR